MKDNLKRELNNLGTRERMELVHALNISNNIRSLQANGIDIAEAFGVELKHVPELLNGSYNYTLDDIATCDYYTDIVNQKLANEKE